MKLSSNEEFGLRCLVRIGHAGVERNAFVGPVGHGLHVLAFGRRCGEEVRCLACVYRSVEAAHRKKPRHRRVVDAVALSGSPPAFEYPSIERGDLCGTRGHEVVLERLVIILNGPDDFRGGRRRGNCRCDGNGENYSGGNVSCGHVGFLSHVELPRVPKRATVSSIPMAPGSDTVLRRLPTASARPPRACIPSKSARHWHW